MACSLIEVAATRPLLPLRNACLSKIKHILSHVTYSLNSLSQSLLLGRESSLLLSLQSLPSILYVLALKTSILGQLEGLQGIGPLLLLLIVTDFSPVGK